MNRLSLYLTLAVGAVLAIGLVIALLSMGWDSWAALGGAMVLGVALTWPVSFTILRRIKRQDPDRKVIKIDGVSPDTPPPDV